MIKQISLPKIKLDDFMAVSTYIDTNKTAETIPITTQIKIEVIFGVCYLTKTNSTNFVVYSFDTGEEDIQMLVNESNLRSFLNVSKGTTIQIVEKENVIIFNDGYFKPSYGKEIFEFILFPKIPKIKSENPVIFDKKLISMLNVSKAFVSKDELRPTFLYVHIKGNMIFSTTLILNYTNKMEANYGSEIISLSPLECKLISNFDKVEYSYSENLNIFKCGDTTYGSVLKEDIKDMSEAFINFNNTLDKNVYCKVLKSDLFNFCNSTVVFSKNIKDCFVNASFTVLSSNQIKLNFSDEKMQNPLIISAKIQGVEPGYSFCFSQESLTKLLETLTYDDINISPLMNNEGMVGVWSDSDSNFLAMVMKMQNVQNA